MAKKGENRELVTLKCTVCGEKNYRTPKNKKNIATVQDHRYIILNFLPKYD